MPAPAGAFHKAEREAVYRAIHNRGGVRSQFRPDPIADDMLQRLLMAARHAPSVGFMLPWNFILIRSAAVKDQIRAACQTASEEAAELFFGLQRALYSQLNLQEISEAPVNFCITCGEWTMFRRAKLLGARKLWLPAAQNP